MSELHKFHQDLIEQSAFPIQITSQVEEEGIERFYVNESFLKSFGYTTRDEFFKQPIGACTAPHDLDRVTKIRFGRRKNETVPTDFECDALKKDGTIFPVQVFVQSILWSGKAAVQCTYIDLTARKQTESALQQSEVRFRSLAENAPVGIFETDPACKCIYVNERWSEIAGLTEKEALGDGWIELIHPDDREKVFEAWSAATTEHTPFHLQYRFQRPDGSVSWVLGQAAAKTDAHGQSIGYVGTITDITEREQAARLQERFLHAIDNLPEQIGLYDSDLHLIHGNQEFRKAAGEGADLLIPGITLDDVLRIRYQYGNVPEGAKGREEEWIAERVRRFHTPSTPWAFERDGKFFETRDEVLLDGSRMVIVTDITDHKQASDALQQSEARFRELIEGWDLGIHIGTAVNGRTFANQACAALFGFGSPEELISTSGGSLIAETDRQRVLAINRRIYEGEIDRAIYEFRGVRKDGSTIPIQAFARRIHWDGEEAIQRTFIDLTSRKLAEAALRRSEESLTKAQQIAKLGNWDWDIVTNDLYWSDEIYRIFGFEPQEFTATYETILNNVHPDDRELVEHHITRALKENEPYKIDHKICLPSGEERFVHEQGEVEFDDAGNPIRMVGTTQDITDRKRAELKLRASEARYRDLIEGSNLGILISNRNKDRLFANLACAELFGYDTPDEILSVSHRGLAVPRIRGMSTKYVDALFAGEVIPPSYEYEGLRKDGSIIPLQVFMRRILWEGHDAVQRTFIDLTDRKEAERALRETAERLNEAQRIANFGNWNLDLVNNVLEWSDEVYQIFEMDPARFGASYEAFLDAVHPDDREMVDNGYTHSLDTRSSFEIEHRLRMPDGRIKWVHERCQSHFDVNGTPLRSMGTVQDITERKRAEQENARLEQRLRQAQKMEALGTLAGGTAHEFNNLLMPITTFTELAMRELPNDSRTHQNLAKVLECAIRATQIVEKILSFSRADDPLFEPIDLRRVVDESLEILQASLPATIAIHTDLSEESCTALADKNQIHQIILNLAANAAHAMEGKVGELVISLVNVEFPEDFAGNFTSLEKGSYARLSIKDAGSGIDKANMNRIFEPFFTTKEVGEGTGLGLALIHGIVADHDGGVEVTSELGCGTTFDVYLPLLKECEVALAVKA